MTKQRVPVATVLLIGANIVSAFTLLVHPEAVKEFGFNPDHPIALTAITSLFLHANLFHLLGNMLFLAAVGAAVELATGSLRFCVVYFLSGIAGVGLHYLLSRGSVEPLVGASGCIAGCAAYYSFRYTRMKVALAPKRAVTVAAITGVWVVLQFIGAFVKIGASPGQVAYWAHLGGFAAGTILSFLFRVPDFAQIQLGHAVLDQMNARGPAAAELAAKVYLQEHPKDLRARWELADALSQQEERNAEAEVLAQIIDDGGEDDLVRAVRRLCQVGLASRLSVLKRLQLADRLREPAPNLSRALLRSVIEGPQDEPQIPDALLSLIVIEREQNPAPAQALLNELVDKYPLHPAVDSARKRGWIT